MTSTPQIKEIIVTPIFILTCDRLTVLRESIKSYHENIQTPFELVLIDFGSSYSPMKEFLAGEADKGVIVYRLDRITHCAQLNQASEIIRDYFTTHEDSNYVVTDPDIALESSSGNVLGVYKYLLDNTDVAVIGPMLMINDIPDYYPLKDLLINGSLGLHNYFHSQPVKTMNMGDEVLKYIYAPLDTTFGMYRSGSIWGRLKNGIRVLSPYAARHLDWYIDPNNIPPDQSYYMDNAAVEVANWSKWRDVIAK